MRKMFEQHGYERMEKAQAQTDSEIIVSVNGTIYEIGDDYSWVRDKAGIYALGSGGHIALGALHALLPEGKLTLAEAKRICTRAIEIAAGLDPYTALPLRVYTQRQVKEKGIE
jgi:ATP-dependent protease HslVU (ClpYQ) peptidase subunit